ncbi:MAG TPA: DEAD/DEAH box helicase family protein [Thermoleophilaceae bacterium]|jgi:superfamily II DNA or RNA helicase
MPFDRMAFEGEWRRYQELALAAFDADLARGNRKTHVVAPPGSGKTLIGMEIVRRRAMAALVLCPNAAIQSQWLAVARRFGASEHEVATEPGALICVLTYQSLCQLRDPGATLVELARSRWAEEKATATGLSHGELLDEARTYHGTAAERHRRELARITAQLKRQIARGEELSAELLAILAPQARARIEALAARGPGQTVVLDECHHLASLWGYVVREALLEIGDPHVVGLTATAPEELSGEGAELYEHLLGEIDFVVPTPAVVRDGYLAPYQELCHPVEPLASELDWLREHDLRFNEMVNELHDDAESELSFPRYVIERVRGRARDEDEAAEIRFSEFQRRHPALARAAIRFLYSGGLELPHDAPRGEAYQQPVDLDDWIVLLQDYALRRLATDPGQAAAERYEQIARALRDLGFVLTRQGIRRGADEADRVLAASQSKAIACARIIDVETSARGDDIRCVILCDTEVERGGSETGLDLDTTSVRGLLGALGDDPGCAILRPLAVTGRSVLCLPRDAAILAAAQSTGELAVRVHEEDGLCRLEGPGWTTRQWVAAATAALTDGTTKLLVGTRGLLGEGWDCPCVNCLIDLTAVAANVSARQIRGRSLRLDPERPEKLASNWDVVCVAPEITQGGSDYDRFVRRHLHLHAPCEDGSIEVGPSHVHAALSPFHPPNEEEIGEVTKTCLARAADHATARERWRIGEPYRGIETTAVVVKSRRGGRRTVEVEPPDYRIPLAAPLGTAALVGVGAVAAALLVAPAAAAVGALTLPLVWRASREVERARALHGALAPLDLIAQAIAAAYVDLGEVRSEAAHSLTAEPRPGGYVRMRMSAAEPEESELFAVALDEALAPPSSPRYLLSRPVARDDDSTIAALGRAATGDFPLATWDIWHAVPADLGRRKERAQALERHWRVWVAPRTRLVFCGQRDAGQAELSAARSQDADFQLHLRTLWD